MDAKLFEVRDSMTFMPCLAIRLDPTNEADRYLLSRTGYGTNADRQREYVLFGKIAGGDDLEFQCDPQCSATSRTMTVAHQHVIDNFDELTSGDVVDVEFLMGERSEPKASERLTP